MPGGGIRADNVVEIVRRTGCRDVHTGAATPADDRPLSASRPVEVCVAGHAGELAHRTVDGAAVSAIVSALREAALIARPSH
jgi:copper homeostasis protein CutC